VQALVKLTLLALAVFACWAFLRSLRWRSLDGALVRLSSRSVWLVTLTTAALLSVGAQAHSQFRNGWTSYAPLTYVAVVVIIGTATGILYLSRKVAAGGAVWTITAIVLAVIAGVSLNISYELYYVAVPIVVLVLLIQPVHSDSRIGRRAAWIVGGAFVAAFSAVFVAIRLWIASACSDKECYSGTELELSSALIGTFARNVLGAVPGAARSELEEDLASVGWTDRMPGLVSPAALLVATALAIGFVYLGFRISGMRDPLDTTTQEHSPRLESRLLLITALVPASAGVGSALVMALSVQAQDVIDSIGDPYRNTMATWTLFAFAGSMVIRAATLVWSRRAATALVIGVAVAMVAMGAHALTTNLPALAASRAHPTTIIVDSIQWETVLGDLTRAGDERRCQTLEDLSESRIGSGSLNRITSGAEAAFQHYHGQSYCSTGLPDGA
jgi:hypothetical protein